MNYFKAHIECQSVAALDWRKVKEGTSVRYVVFDKDNTLTLPYKLEFES